MTAWAITSKPCGCSEERSGPALVFVPCPEHTVPYVSPRREARRRHRERKRGGDEG